MISAGEMGYQNSKNGEYDDEDDNMFAASFCHIADQVREVAITR